MITKAFEYISKNETRFIKELQGFLRFPSVSTQIARKNDLWQCATWLKNHLENIGLQTQLIGADGHPIVLATAKGRSSKRLIIYGHYDVQPEDPIDQWKFTPFKPVTREGFIYARGATDDKGQLFAHIKGVESLIRTSKQLPCEVIFLIEGEEESGGTTLTEYIRTHKVNLAADAIVISDTTMYDENTPAITYGLRGLVTLEMTVKTASGDLHSGLFGGAVANAATVLAQIISKCVGPNGDIQIPGFYDNVRPLTDWEKENIQGLPQNDDQPFKDTRLKQTFGEAGFSTLERIWARPTFETNSIVGGYTGTGVKPIIPSSATAQISIRLVPDQDPDIIANLVKKHVNFTCPDFASIEIKGSLRATKAVLFDIEDPMIKAGWYALKHGFGADPVYVRCGSTIPVANTFSEELQSPVLLMGFGLDSDGAHAPNERFKIDNLISGAKASAYLIANMQKTRPRGGSRCESEHG